jgi:hypothetical protein
VLTRDGRLVAVFVDVLLALEATPW